MRKSFVRNILLFILNSLRCTCSPAEGNIWIENIAIDFRNLGEVPIARDVVAVLATI